MGRVYDKLTKEQKTAFDYALMYPLNKARIDALMDSRKAIRYDTDKVQTSHDADFTHTTVMNVMRLENRNRNIDDALIEVFQEYGDVTVQMAKQMLCYGRKKVDVELEYGRLPMGSNQYYRLRRMFWTVLAERI